VAFFAHSSSPPGRCARHASSDCERFDPTIAQGGASVPGNPLKTPGDAVTCGGVPRHGICRALVDVIRQANVSKVVTSGSEQLTMLNGVDLEVPRGQLVGRRPVRTASPRCSGSSPGSMRVVGGHLHRRPEHHAHEGGRPRRPARRESRLTHLRWSRTAGLSSPTVCSIASTFESETRSRLDDRFSRFG
jgi:hypothetical protein